MSRIEVVSELLVLSGRVMDWRVSFVVKYGLQDCLASHP
jgi:hypothetical protein